MDVDTKEELLLALEELVKNIDLSKLKVRRDYSLLVAHAYATKVILKTKEVQPNA